jgi:hypothetical protein
MKPVFLKLAFLEYFRSTSVRAPGGRDFLWMTMLMFFIQLLALVILTAREGVLERSVDAFLGNKPGFGIPIWTLPNFLGENQPILITTDLIDTMQNGGYRAAPFRRLNNDQMIRLPDKNIWAENTRVDEIKFSGMATDFRGPMVPHDAAELRRMQRPQPGSGLFSWGEAPLPSEQLNQFEYEPYKVKNGNWDIILDENLFKKYFDLKEYARVLKGQVPQSVIEQIPTDINQITQMKQIWLQVKVHKSEYLMPFNVKWAKYFGIGAGNTAFIVPIELFNLFVVAKENPKLCAFLEQGPKLGRRILSLKSDRLMGMSKKDKNAIRADFEKLSVAMGGRVDNVGSRISLYLGDRKKDQKALRSACDAGVSELQLMLFAKDLGLKDIDQRFNEVLNSHSKLSGRPNVVYANCDALSDRTLRGAQLTGTGAKCVAEIPMATEGTGYSEMLLFAQKRLEIKKLVDFMSCRPSKNNPNPMGRKHLCIAANAKGNVAESRLMINQIYEDSLTRFGFLTELLNGISGPIGVVMIGMLAAILWVQLGTVLDHRRFRYAMLLSNGISWLQLKLMIITQVILGVSISLVFAVGCFILIKYYLIDEMSEISTVYEKITLGNAIDVLPVSVISVLTVSVATMSVAIILTLIQLALNKLSARKPLENLLS